MAAYYGVVFADFAVTEDEHALGELRHVVLMCYQHDRQSWSFKF